MSFHFTLERLITLLSEASLLLSAGMTTGDGFPSSFPAAATCPPAGSAVLRSPPASLLPTPERRQAMAVEAALAGRLAAHEPHGVDPA